MKGWVPSFFVVCPSYIEKIVICVRILKKERKI